jgi:hypothetical protein
MERGSDDYVFLADAGVAENANEMDTSELHRTSILFAALAMTTDRSMHRRQSREKTVIAQVSSNYENRYSASRSRSCAAKIA